MTARTKVVISTVGPFIHYGEPLVDACIKEGTHYVDSTGESPFVYVSNIHAAPRDMKWFVGVWGPDNFFVTPLVEHHQKVPYRGTKQERHHCPSMWFRLCAL